MKAKTDQIRQIHARFIHTVVRAVQNQDGRSELEQALVVAAENGWTDVVRAVRLVLEGRRDSGILRGLDEEDRAIVSGILEGLQNPSALPDPTANPDPSAAAPGLARLLAAAAGGDVDALHWLGVMGEQMTAAGGEMAQIAGRFRALLNGERDPDKLTGGMTARSRSLTLSLLDELARLESH